MMHSHPGGDPTPSQADIEMTRVLVEAAKPLGIAVHDHIIVGKQGQASLRGLRLILDMLRPLSHEGRTSFARREAFRFRPLAACLSSPLKLPLQPA
jgi:hypothetical protein